LTKTETYGVSVQSVENIVEMMYQVKTRIRHSEDCASWYILIIEAKKMHYFSNLFW